MRKIILAAFFAATIYAPAARAQCSFPNICLPLSGVPVLSGALSLLTGTDYCISSSTIIAGTVNIATGSTVYEGADLQATGITIQQPGGLILCNGATTTVDNLDLSVANALSVPSTLTQFCIRVNNALNISALQSNLGSNVHFCLAPGATVVGENNLASATVATNCSSCAVALPVRVTSFTGSLAAGAARLEWHAYERGATMRYVIERMEADGRFDAVQKIIAKGAPGENVYTFTDPAPAEKYNYYRIGITEDGSMSYTSTVRIAGPAADAPYSLSYAGVAATFHAAFDRTQPIVLSVHDWSGRTLETRTVDAGAQQQSTLPAGMYLLCASQNGIADRARIVIP